MQKSRGEGVQKSLEEGVQRKGEVRGVGDRVRTGRALRSARAGGAARVPRARGWRPGLRDVRPDQERYAYHERDDGPDRGGAMMDGATHEMQRVRRPRYVQNP